MKMKIIVSLLLLIAVVFTGCVEQEGPGEEIPEEEPEEEIPEEEPEEEIPEEEVPEEEPEPTPAPEPQSYTVRIDNFVFIPSELEINRGDTVVWFNRNEPPRIFTLVSEDMIFENASVPYRDTYRYTFNQTGTFNITAYPFPERMEMTIIVK